MDQTEQGEGPSAGRRKRLGWMGPLAVGGNAWRQQLLDAVYTARHRISWGTWAELGVIVLWALFVGRAYLSMDPTMWPHGNEFPFAIQSHYIWDLLPRCGICVFWNGFMNGGAPAFVELHGAPLHPLVILTTLLAGAINGTKITLIICLVAVGLGQWWLASVMQLGRTARLWSAALAVVGGHLAGRMDAGVFAVVLSTAMASLVIAPALELALTGRRRSAVLLGVTLALTLLSGQGYLQLGLLFGLFPALLLLLFDKKWTLRSTWKEFLLAGLLAVTLAGILTVPLLHFAPQVDKFRDPELRSAQPLEYIILNFLIRDVPFYRSNALFKQPYPYLYVNYISWVPLLLAIAALRLAPRPMPRRLLFFLLAIGLILLASSGATFKYFSPLMPGFMAGIQNPSLIAGLAVPLILGLAAWGLDLLLKLQWPKLTADLATGHTLSINTSWIFLAFPLLWAILSAGELGQPWLSLVPEKPNLDRVLRAMEPETAQWIAPPFGENFWNPVALQSGLKLTRALRPWWWKGREKPSPYIEGTRDPTAPKDPAYIETVDDIHLLLHPENEYAFVEAADRPIPCQATALGGQIDVTCQNKVDGTLVVREYTWTGWRAYRDGERVPLDEGPWLSVSAPAGEHHYAFRYRPWDVWAGLLSTLGGIGWAIWLWIRSPNRRSSRAGERAPPDRAGPAQ